MLEAGLCFFSIDTKVAVPSSERAIGSLRVGDHILAYDPAIGTTSIQTVQHVWINHDTDLLDVTLHSADTVHLTAETSDAKQRAVALRAHGLRAPPDDQADLARADATTSAATAAGASQGETVHTTANYHWLTTDRGWVLAGD